MSDFKSVIDIGTNSFHLIIAEISSDGMVNTIHREKVVVRLGTESQGVFKRISENEMNKGLGVLQEFRKLSDFFKAEIFAVGTSALRESENRDDFIALAKKETGIDIQVINGETEAEFIYLGISRALQVYGKKILCTDIGGGSTEVIIGTDGKFDFIKSLKVGAVRLSKIFFPGYITSPDSIRKCSDHIENVFSEHDLTRYRSSFELAIGASGTITSIANVISFTKYGSVPREINGFTFSSEELKEAAKWILKFPTMEERASIEGIDPGRAEILPAGTLILQKLFSMMAIKELTISSYALREGFLLSTLRK